MCVLLHRLTNIMVQSIELFSLVGGGVLCVNTWPQIYKVWKSESAKDLSYLFIILNGIGLTLMDVYGILKSDYSLYIPISISLANTLVLFGLKVRTDHKHAINDNVSVTCFVL